MDELLREVRQDVKEIKVEVLELVKLGAVANQTLIEHERRSTNLETRMVPLEKTNTILLFMAAVSTLVLSVYKLFLT